MFCPDGEVIFNHNYPADKMCPSSLMLDSSQGTLLEYIRGYMESLNPKFALYGSKNECTRPDYVFPLLSEVSTRVVTLEEQSEIDTLVHIGLNI